MLTHTKTHVHTYIFWGPDPGQRHQGQLSLKNISNESETVLGSSSATEDKTKIVPQVRAVTKTLSSYTTWQMVTADCILGSMSAKAGSVWGLSNASRFHTKT